MSVDFWANALVSLGVRADTSDDWADTFARVMASQTFSDDADLPNFLGQVLHESGMLERSVENLNYGAERLMAVWPRRFPTITVAQKYARNPQALANFVYGGRLGNSAPDDGWRYRGRGLIQITGRANYELMESITGLPLLDNPDLLTEQEPALRCSIVWWETNVPDSVLGDVTRVTRIVNGGTNGLEHREQLTERAYRILSGGRAAYEATE